MPIDESRPWVSDNCRVHPEFVQQANAELKHRGVQNAMFDERGRAVAHSQTGRNEILKYMGFIDKSGGYRDYTGG